ncbi:acylphosphatase [Mesorhizobium sp. L-8-10]|uniref:acylphosphatase n=1 Tax=Mesorhizobium sp. L-8-10 TaxID=2744523 RepID=UPI001929602F|nr:acylphosphatase [Mesorhizobium sp. L-8-10]BCH33915.1 acylphosphatase [Mesorhizobium sp. L-8-10]
MTDDREAMLASITGKVQGVGFRAWAWTEARELRLSGWVRNEPDGSVTALLIGPAKTLAAMVERLRTGPPGASVSGVVTSEARLRDEPAGFTIIG